MPEAQGWFSEWGPWLAAIGLAGERLLKLWSDYKIRRGEEAKIRLLDGDSIFRRANELMDRYKAEIEAQDKQLADQDRVLAEQGAEISRLRGEILSLQGRIAVLESGHGRELDPT